MADIPLPPGFTEAKVTQAQRAFESVLGAKKVFFTDLDRTSYEDKFAVDDAAHHPVGAIAPESVEEVQAALRVANQYRLPIWPISRGKNLGYGGTAPLLAGSVVMDLSRMKKIEFDEANGTVIVEPGVSFYDLYDYIQANNLPFWISTPGNSWGSVMGNALDRGLGYTPYGEHTKRICGMEVVLPSGELVRTGMGAAQGAPSWQLYPFGFGPGWDQMFVQSNFGVVTKMGLWLMPEPESLMGMDVEFDRPEDLKAMIDTIGPLRREGVLQQSPSIGNWLRAAAVLTTRDQWTDEPGALSDAVIDKIRKQFGIGWWGVSLRLYGREEVNKAAYKILEKAMNDINPMAIKPTSWVKGEPLEYTGWTGTPMTFPMQNVNWYGGRGGHIGFSPVLPQDGTAALEQFKRTYARYQEYGMDYQGSFAFGERHLLNVNAMIFDKDSPEMMAKVDPFFRTLVADAKQHGYCEYRTHLDYMDLVSDTYDFNGGSLRRLNETVKDALDPNGILAPGKSGIWPKGSKGRVA
ncbi:4-cresol dehydrogenase (hydroxylating) [Altererythrobacter atlanticus]|uniref:4-cresol dehydrogenase [hydroxylating] flavoprotein subunit n=1 Tax=Croceibacterium atlanticum TaxID=1267766 RepID=A0A0F7KYN6_9SPHN|nr:FAD-binding oxidoreductase [Croceibacterium atlanticum]AKH43910.1 4-cresol dehydrogenase [hydroxylating] flavoprotein subunit [Croceibacterium atlanticum]MBB5733640.1 4-cresol dehydrogenase (hydroxylating) [Croceibacterium atlanticum]